MASGRTVVVVFAVLLMSAEATALPWRPREPPKAPPTAHQLKDPFTWPPEPAVPDPVDAIRFRASLAHLCNRTPEAVPATELLAAAQEAGVDPFLLGGLMFQQSRCTMKAKRRNPKLGYGPLGIQPALYRAPGAPPPPVSRKELTTSALSDPRRTLSIGARLLRMWQDSHEELDSSFGGAVHRSGVAHFVWGDKVRSSGTEDLVFTARRRMVAHYLAQLDTPRLTALGIPVVSPLEGNPRVASSGPGEDRDGGARRHRGIDIAASEGEPVRSIADGKVIFAGANLRSNPRRGEIPPSKIARYRHRRLGPGGIYVCIRHDGADKEIVSCYMHLDTYVIAKDDAVKAGQLIGFVGRTGVKVSPPHLHFELRVDDRAMNPIRYFTDIVIPPKATTTHRYTLSAMRARRAKKAAGGGASSQQ